MTEDHDIDVSHDIASFVSELRRLADALEDSTEFTIHIDGKDVTIPEGAKFSVAHEREAGEVELEFQITWSDDPEAEDAEDETDEDTEDETDEDTEDETDKDTEDETDEDTEDETDVGTEDQNADANRSSETTQV
jgi:amphi-Trp domain-containing protein